MCNLLVDFVSLQKTLCGDQNFGVGKGNSNILTSINSIMKTVDPESFFCYPWGKSKIIWLSLNLITNEQIKILKTVAIIILLLPWQWRIFHFYLSFDNQKNILIKRCTSICTSYCPLQNNSCTGVCHVEDVAAGGKIPPEKVLILKLCIKKTQRTY